ncbi:MAG: terminase large subunit domain-containing protein [Gammaproteobacteria bacterium]
MFKLELTDPQWEFFHMRDKFPLFVAGFGSGKSRALIVRGISLLLQYKELIDIAYYEPTYNLAHMVLIPTLMEILENAGIQYIFNKHDSLFTIPGVGSIRCISMERPSRIIGFEVMFSFVDELDTIPAEKAREAWNRIISRNRKPPPRGAINQVFTASTPEGFHFLYERWVENPKEGYTYIRAPSSSNPYLPHDYVTTLRESYSPALVQAYLEGRFVNLTAGSVYADFDRHENHCDTEPTHHEHLMVGMDFNVNRMCASVAVRRNKQIHFVDEIVNERDTPSLLNVLEERYSRWPITIYPDATGDHRHSTNATEADLSLVRDRGYRIIKNPKNPPIKHRVMAVNAMILNGLGQRCLKVNTKRCKHLTKGLEQQVWKNGLPEKGEGRWDDICFTGDVRVRTPGGDIPFCKLPICGKVLGPYGNFVNYSNAGIKNDNKPCVRVDFENGSYITCTSDHEFLTLDGWTQAYALTGKHCYKSKSIKDSRIPSSSMRKHRYFSASDTEKTLEDTTFVRLQHRTRSVFNAICTEPSTRLNTTFFPKATISTFIIRMKTKIIINTIISNFSHALRTLKNIWIRQKEEKEASNWQHIKIERRFFLLLPRGIDLRQVGYGIKNIIQKCRAFFMNANIPVFAPFAANATSPPNPTVFIAVKTAKQKEGYYPVSTTKHGFVGNVTTTLLSTNTQSMYFALVHVLRREKHHRNLRKASKKRVHIAKRLLLQEQKKRNFVQHDAIRHGDVLWDWITKCVNAVGVSNRSKNEKADQQNTAHASVVGLLVVKVTSAPSQPVYCLTVPEFGCFMHPNGIVTSQCDSAGYIINHTNPILTRVPSTQRAVGA